MFCIVAKLLTALEASWGFVHFNRPCQNQLDNGAQVEKTSCLSKMGSILSQVLQGSCLKDTSQLNSLCSEDEESPAGSGADS